MPETHRATGSNIKSEEEMFEPTEPGTALGIGTGRAVNLRLQALGLQDRVNNTTNLDSRLEERV